MDMLIKCLCPTLACQMGPISQYLAIIGSLTGIWVLFGILVCLPFDQFIGARASLRVHCGTHTVGNAGFNRGTSVYLLLNLVSTQALTALVINSLLKRHVGVFRDRPLGTSAKRGKRDCRSRDGRGVFPMQTPRLCCGT